MQIDTNFMLFICIEEVYVYILIIKNYYKIFILC